MSDVSKTLARLRELGADVLTTERTLAAAREDASSATLRVSLLERELREMQSREHALWCELRTGITDEIRGKK